MNSAIDRWRAKDPRQGSSIHQGSWVRRPPELWFIACERQCDAPHIIPRPPPLGFSARIPGAEIRQPISFSGRSFEERNFAMKMLVLTVAAVAALAAAVSAPAEARGLRLHGGAGAGAAVAI